MSLDALASPIMPAWFSQLGLMGWPLAVCAVVACAIGFERAVFVVRTIMGFDRQRARLAGHLRSSQTLPKPVRDEQIAIWLREARPPYFCGLKLLRMIGTVSPILGLLGTVLGIIASFKVIAAHTGPVSPSLIADGLWEAMLTTAVGLLIALPALVMVQVFAAFGHRELERLALDLRRLSLSFEHDEPAEPLDVVEFKTGTARP